MKILLSILCILVAGNLYLGIEARGHRANEEEKYGTKEAEKMSITPSAAKSVPKPPILVQIEIFKYGTGDESQVGVEGKIYNPNSIALSNVKVRWHFPKVSDKDAEILARGNFEDSCGFVFLYIPPLTTYDFKTDRIRGRYPENLFPWGLTGIGTDLTPVLTFEPAP